MPVIHMNTEEASIRATLKSLVSDRAQTDKPIIVFFSSRPTQDSNHHLPWTKHTNTGPILKLSYKSSTKKVKKMKWIVFFLSLTYIKKMSFASPLRHRKSVDLPPDRAGGGKLRGIHSHSNSSWNDVLLGEKKKKNTECTLFWVFFFFLFLTTKHRSYGCSISPLALHSG